MFCLKERDREPLMRELERLDALYDPEWKAPRGYLEKANYHTNLARCTIHSTTAALNYALALLDSGLDSNIPRAVDIIDNMISLQSTDPVDKTFGIWSWYMEEPLDKMSPPDWNWADFCGSTLVQCYVFHKDRLPEDLLARMETCIRNACLSIFRRNVTIRYTNISIMGSFVTLCAGETFGWEDMMEYGRACLRHQAAFVRQNGCFSEFNSPTYTVVAMGDLTRIVQNVHDEEARALAGELLDLAWKSCAEHYHAPTGQWVGPCTRAYTWLLGPNVRALLARALDDPSFEPEDKSRNFSLEWTHVDWHCPEQYRHYFYDCPERDLNLGFYESTGFELSQKTVATAHIEPDFALTSFLRQDTWNQRRNVYGFWGGRKVRFINMTCLHNLYDFSGAEAVVAQKKGAALIGVSAMPDAGDTHVSIDMIKNGAIEAWDLRLRVELGGGIEGEPVLDGDTILLNDAGMTVRVRLLGGRFEGQPLKLELHTTADDQPMLDAQEDLHRRFVGDEKRWYADVVFYHGASKTIHLDQLREMWAVLSVEIGRDIPPCEERAACENGTVSASFQRPGTSLAITFPEKPCPRAAWKGRAWVDGQNLDELYHTNV